MWVSVCGPGAIRASLHPFWTQVLSANQPGEKGRKVSTLKNPLAPATYFNERMVDFSFGVLWSGSSAMRCVLLGC